MIERKSWIYHYIWYAAIFITVLIDKSASILEAVLLAMLLNIVALGFDWLVNDKFDNGK